ncbi:hypothetical protein L3Q82_001723 [Scortum barcoo]|uniref:Uncharacterized protein n=1 Tax=Scortum barcoo TaxID=214431 RepID=A0ACB8W3T1_9TELE|nr:hypothetical protein L3Q82_001723 [Scortum barcoo]
MHREAEPAGTFKTMDGELKTFKAATNPGDDKSCFNGGYGEIKRRLSFSSDKDVGTAKDTEAGTTQSAQDDSDAPGQLPAQAQNTPFKTNGKVQLEDVASEHQVNSKHQCVDSEDKENTANIPTDDTQEEGTSGQRSLPDSSEAASKQHSNTADSDAEVVRRAREEGHVSVVFPGTVTQEGCCRFVSEILKCILYQRQQLPMTYDQLVYSQKKQQASVQDRDIVSRRPVQSADMDWRKCQQTLQELEEVLQQLEVLFSLSRVPRVLLLMGGSLVLPKEMYEINMEALVVASGDQCLRVSSCLRQLFRTLFVADLLSDARPVRLMPTTVLTLAHRDCGVAWFRPKLQFKVPTRAKNQIISLSTDTSTCEGPSK